MRIAEVQPVKVLGFLNDVEAKYAPEVLYACGDLDLLQQGPKVSVVGSRNATDAGLARARKFVRQLVEHGAVVVSGLAKGIDTVAHELRRSPK